MIENNELPDVVMPHCPHRDLLTGQKALVTGAPGKAFYNNGR